MVKKKGKGKKSVSKRSAPRIPKVRGISRAFAIAALLLNVLIIPGLGSLIAGKTKVGVWQLVLAVIGIILSFFIIGIPILIAAWIWGLVTGIVLIQESG